MLRDDAALLDIANFARQILELTMGMSREEFDADLRTQLTVLYYTSLLTGAVKRLFSEFRTQHREIPWVDIIEKRMATVDQCEKVRLDVQWGTIQNSILLLLTMIEPLLPVEEN